MVSFGETLGGITKLITGVLFNLYFGRLCHHQDLQLTPYFHSINNLKSLRNHERYFVKRNQVYTFPVLILQPFEITK
jgi:hypothetical protein